MKSVTCIIPSSGSDKAMPYLKKCIQSLIHGSKKRFNLIICVVSDEEKLPQKLVNANILISNFYLVNSSLSFSEMNNIAIEESVHFYESDYYLLLNDDAKIGENFFKNLKHKTNADLIVPLILNEFGTSIDSYGQEYFKSGHVRNAQSLEVQTQAATAACLIIKTSFLKKIFKKSGFYFHPVLQYYMEDTELVLRARALGAKIVKDQNLVVYHKGSLTAGKKSYFVIFQTYRNVLWMIILIWPAKFIVGNLISILLVQWWLTFHSFLLFGPGLYLRVIRDTICNLPRLFYYRKLTNSIYKSDRFGDLLSGYTYRTYHGMTLKL